MISTRTQPDLWSSFYDRIRQFLKFGIVGLSNTLIALGVYYSVIGIGAHYQVANIAAFVLSSLSGFFLNRMWVFKATNHPVVAQIVKYYLVYSSSLFLSIGLSFTWVEILKVSEYLAPLLNLLVTIPFNYIMSKKWAFRTRQEDAFHKA